MTEKVENAISFYCVRFEIEMAITGETGDHVVNISRYFFFFPKVRRRLHGCCFPLHIKFNLFSSLIEFCSGFVGSLY